MISSPQQVSDVKADFLQHFVRTHADDLREFGCDDQGNAKRFLLLHGDRVRFVDKWSTWLWWDRARWCDDRLKVERLAGDVQEILVREAQNESGDRRTDLLRHAARCGSGRTIRELLFQDPQFRHGRGLFCHLTHVCHFESVST